MIPGIKRIWVLIGMTLQIVDKPLILAMKIMVLTVSLSIHVLQLSSVYVLVGS
jgi:hypothetical protein